PRDIVEDVVESGDDQHAVEEAVGKKSPAAGAHDAVAHPVDTAVERRKGETECRSEHETCQAADDRHEAAAGEEGEIVGQLEAGEAVIEGAADQTGDDSDRDVELVDRGGAPRRLDGLSRVVGEAGSDVSGHCQKYLCPVRSNEIAGDPG